MADGKKVKTNKTQKPYTTENKNGQFTVRMLEKGVDGRYHSMVFALPQIRLVDGKQKKATSKDLIKEALKEMLCFYPNLTKQGRRKQEKTSCFYYVDMI